MATIIKLKRGTVHQQLVIWAMVKLVLILQQKFYINDSGTIKEIGGGTSSGDSTSP